MADEGSLEIVEAVEHFRGRAERTRLGGPAGPMPVAVEAQLVTVLLLLELVRTVRSVNKHTHETQDAVNKLRADVKRMAADVHQLERRIPADL
jgi:hypothetical protein